MRVDVLPHFHNGRVNGFSLQIQPKRVALPMQIFKLGLQFIDTHVRLLFLLDLSIGESREIIGIYITNYVLIRNVRLIVFKRVGSLPGFLRQAGHDTFVLPLGDVLISINN